MIPRIRSVTAEPNYRLSVLFDDGKRVMYDVKDDIDTIARYKDLECIHGLFEYGREIGYVLSKDYWGRGLMCEAVKAIMAYCFSQLNYDILTCGHFIHNHQSQRVIEKSGFRFLKEIQYEARMHTIEPTRLYVAFPPKKAE